MRSGQELKITVFDGNKKPIEMGLPLLGFGLAFDKAQGIASKVVCPGRGAA